MSALSARQRDCLAALGITVYRLRQPSRSGPGTRRWIGFALYLSPEQRVKERDGKLLRQLRRALGGAELVDRVAPGLCLIAVGTAHSEAVIELPSLDQLRADPSLKARVWQELIRLGACAAP